jgi:major membrane immunogen (membrane-anchored lipoprotein)
MNKLTITLFMMCTLILFGACSENDDEKKTSNPIGNDQPGEDKIIPTNYFIESDTTSLDNANIYLVHTSVFNNTIYLL